MRRILIALVMSGAVVVAAPTVATAAHHHVRHHSRHHARHRRLRNARRERFGHWDTNGSAQPAGTVSSFTDNGDGTGTLTIMVGNNPETGIVNNDTELACTSSNANNQQGEDNDGDDNGGSNTSGDGGSSSNTGDDNGGSGDDNGGTGDDNGGTGDDNGGTGDDNGDNGAQMCSTANLTSGTSVADAVLEITNSGAIWTKVELITS